LRSSSGKSRARQRPFDRQVSPGMVVAENSSVFRLLLYRHHRTIKAVHAGHVHVSVRAGHGVGGVRGLFAAASSALSGTGADADRHLESVAVAAAMHLLALSGVAASGHRAATAGSAAGRLGVAKLHGTS
jgi:hypothetical protein